MPIASLSFDDAGSKSGVHRHDTDIPELSGRAWVYATFHMGPQNPAPYVDALPAAAQMLTLGHLKAEKFEPLFSFGLADAFGDPRNQITQGKEPAITPAGDLSERPDQAYLSAAILAGKHENFGPYARPNGTFDFKLHIDLDTARLTAWTAGRGDNDWFLLAEDLPLPAGTMINHLHVEQCPQARGISDVVISSEPWQDGEQLRTDTDVRHDIVVAPNQGFKFQSMRSVWGLPGRHVAVSRKPRFHHAFADVALVNERHLIAAWSNKSHSGGTGGVSIAHSYDQGTTWNEGPVVMPGAANCPRIQRLSDGSVLVQCDAIQSRQAQRYHDLQMYRSDDAGQSWKPHATIHATRPEGGGLMEPSRVVEMPDGSWLVSTARYGGTPMAPEPSILEFHRSDDQGRNWSLISSAGQFPPNSPNEPSVVRLADGRLVTYIREWRYDGLPGLKAVSQDDGRSWEFHELPFSVTGRVCAGLLQDGRAMITFRSGIGRAALWAWIGNVDDMTEFQPAGTHFNDAQTVGLKDEALYLDNDGSIGQFTQYTMRPADTPDSIIDVTVEVKVLANRGRAATLSVPYVGKLRLFPDRIALAHDPSVEIAIAPNVFHLIRVVREGKQARIYVDGDLTAEIDKVDARTWREKALKTSVYTLAFGNELDAGDAVTNVFPHQITADVNGCSIWRSVHEILDDPATGKKEYRWSAERDGFPDQYQLDHIIEIEATAIGGDQGYSGWVQFEDGRVFVVNYTDDKAPMLRYDPYVGGGLLGIPWIRGTFLLPSDIELRVVRSR